MTFTRISTGVGWESKVSKPLTPGLCPNTGNIIIHGLDSDLASTGLRSETRETTVKEEMDNYSFGLTRLVPSLFPAQRVGLKALGLRHFVARLYGEVRGGLGPKGCLKG